MSDKLEGISNLLSSKRLDYAEWEAAWTGNLVRFAIITLIIVGICVALLATVSITNIADEWPRYRCSPLFMPVTELFGYDAAENFQFCITNMMKANAGSFFAPIYEMMGDYGSSIKIVIDTINGFRQILGKFKVGVNQYFTGVVSKIQSLLFQVRLSFMRMQTLMGRVYGTFYSIVWMGASAITVGLSLSDNSLVNFIFEFCFDPKTRVRLVDGSEVALESLQVGDHLEGNVRVTSRFVFSGAKTPMVRIGSDILSGSHMVWEEGWIPASKHSQAVPVPSLPTLVCLNVEGHSFHLASGLQVADYDESSSVEANTAAQQMAETALNGSQVHTGLRKDYTLGFDPTCLIQMRDGSWKPATEVQLGDRIVGNQEILGIVQEFCAAPLIWQDIRLAPSQCVHNEGIWQRASSHSLPATDPCILLQFITDRAGPLVIRKGTDLWIRDYREAPLPEMEHPFQWDLA